jgi:hypothetical protein
MRYSGTVFLLAQPSLAAPFPFTAATQSPARVSGKYLHNYQPFPDYPICPPGIFNDAELL